MIRAVFDTNVLASAIVNRTGPAGQILRAWTFGDFDLVVSEVILEELARVVQKNYFRRRLSPKHVAANFTLLRDATVLTPISTQVSGVATHPEDDLILATALSGRADYLVTGDRQLLALGVFQGVAIISPRAFLERLAEP